jgi:hypothetical protein
LPAEAVEKDDFAGTWLTKLETNRVGSFWIERRA